MTRSGFLIVFVLVFAGWNCGGENKKQIEGKISKPLPRYKLAYTKEFGDFSSFRFSFDTIHNTIETVTDSVDVITRDYEIYRHFYDSTYQLTYKDNPFTHYYIKKYCLNKDTFALCKESIADTYRLPLIFELGKRSSRAYTSLKSFESYPTDGIADTTEKIPGNHSYNTIQLAEIDSLFNTSATSILADQSVDLNYDSIPERLIAYQARNGMSYYSILEKQNQKWVSINLLELGFAENAEFSTLQMSGQKNRSVLVKVYSLGYVPRKRYFEDVFLFLPME